MKKCLSLVIAFAMLASMCVLPVSADELTAVATSDVWEVEDFEDYASGNWLEGEWWTNNDDFKANETIGLKAQEWSAAGQYTGATVEVVTDPDDPNNKILHVKSNTSSTNPFLLRKNANKGAAYAIDRTGKKLVMEVDYKIKTFGTSGTWPFFVTSWHKKPNAYNWGVQTTFSGTTFTFKQSGYYQGKYGATAYYKRPHPADTWVSAKHVIDVSEAVSESHSDTSRGYIKGATDADYVLYSGTYNNKSYDASLLYDAYQYENGDRVVDFLPGNIDPVKGNGGVSIEKTNGFFGIVFGMGRNSETTASEYYLDNLKLYYVDELKMGNPVITDTTVEIPFNSEIKDTLVENTTTADGGTLTKTWTLKDMLTLQNEAGEDATESIESVTLSEDKKTVVVALTEDIDQSQSYKILIDVAFCDVYGQGLDDHNIPTEVDVKFSNLPSVTVSDVWEVEDFEDYGSGNWLDSGITSNIINASSKIGVEANAWAANGQTEGAVVEVIADPDNADNKILHVKSNTASDSPLRLRKNSNGSSGISIDRTAGKKLVMEVDFKVGVFGNGNYTLPILGYSHHAAPNMYNWGVAGTLTGSTFTFRESGGYQSDYYAATMYANVHKPDNWVKMKYIVDLSEPVSDTHSDTSRGYAQGPDDDSYVLYSGKYEPKTYNADEVYEAYPYEKGDRVVDFLPAGGKSPKKSNGSISAGEPFYGAIFAMGRNSSTTASEYYIDNLKAYWIDELKMGEPVVVDEKTIEIPFNSEIQETVYEKGYQTKTWTLKEMFTVEDSDGALIENAISSVDLSEDNKTVAITFTNNVDRGKDCKILIDPTFCDVYGQGLDDHNLPVEVNIEAIPKLSAEAAAAVIGENTVSTSLTFNNPTESALDVWYIVAAYGAYGEMLGCKAESLEVAVGEGSPIDVSFTTKNSSTIKTVKVFIWDHYKTMMPYQDAEIIYSEQ